MRRQAINAVDAGDGDLRVRALRQKMAAEPDNLAVRLELARHYEQMGFPEVAGEHYRLAAVQFPNDPQIRIAYSRLLRAQGMHAEASAGLTRFLEGRKQVPELAAAWSLLGILRDEMGDLKSAEGAHRTAVELRPDQDSFHNNLGYNLLLQGIHADAAAEFRRALAIQPNSQIARNNLGLALASQPREAVTQWQSVSDPASAHSNLAAVLIEKGQYADARRELDIALGYKRDHPAALRNLQLVSELDGGEAALAERAFDPWWKRFGRALGRTVVGYDAPETKEASQTASR
jgi:Flp pilus assembly protein TadD